MDVHENVDGFWDAEGGAHLAEHVGLGEAVEGLVVVSSRQVVLGFSEVEGHNKD